MAKIVSNKPLFIMLYGYPGAGKSYFARQFCEQVQAVHVQPDRIRAELFETPHYDKQENAVVDQLAEYMAGEFLAAGVSVVYDANAMRANQRHRWRDMVRRAHVQPLLVWLQIDAETAFLRTSKRDRRRADDRYARPLDRRAFDDIISNMQNPAATEEYVVVSGKHLFNTQLSAVMKRLGELKIVGFGDASSHMIKPGMVNLVPNPAAGRVDLSRRNIRIR